MNKVPLNIFDYILTLAEKSCPESVARQGYVDIWQANREYVIAGIRFVKLLAREVATGPHDYHDLAIIAYNIYKGLLDSEQAVVENLSRRDADWDDLKEVGTAVTAAMYPNIEALLEFDEIDRAHQQARRETPNWRQD